MRLKRAFSFATRITERKLESEIVCHDGDHIIQSLSTIPSSLSSTSSSYTLSTVSSAHSLNGTQALTSNNLSALPVMRVASPANSLVTARRRSACDLPFFADIRRLLPERVTITEDAAIAIWCFSKDLIELLADYCEGPHRLIEGRRLKEALRELMLPEEIEKASRTRWAASFCLKGRYVQYPPLLRTLLQSVTGGRLHAAYQLGIDYMSASNSRSGHSDRFTTSLIKTLSDQIVKHVTKASAELVVQSDRNCVGVNEVLLTLSTDTQLCRAFSMMNLRQQLTEIVYGDPMDVRPSLRNLLYANNNLHPSRSGK
jgi:hypothetical protein